MKSKSQKSRGVAGQLAATALTAPPLGSGVLTNAEARHLLRSPVLGQRAVGLVLALQYAAQEIYNGKKGRPSDAALMSEAAEVIAALHDDSIMLNLVRHALEARKEKT